MTNNNFRTIAQALRDHVGNTYDLLAAADSVEKILPDLTGIPPQRERGSVEHERIVDIALRSSVAMQAMRDGKKINAIKEIRLLAACGLKEAKDASEDERVLTATGYQSYTAPSSWGTPSWDTHYDSDEAPF